MNSDITRPIEDYPNAVDILKLAQMLKPEESSESEDDALPNAGLQKLGPGDICPKKPKPIKRPVDKNAMKGEGKSCDEIRDYEDFLMNNEEQEDNAMLGKTVPQYDITYKQAVTSEDVFLQMGMKTPATSSCEDMLIAIKLPGESMESVDLTLTKDRCLVDCKKFRLDLSLPQKCDPDLSRAQWITQDETLRLTVRMVREFDYVNF